jgi:hypothetical protein
VLLAKLHPISYLQLKPKELRMSHLIRSVRLYLTHAAAFAKLRTAPASTPCTLQARNPLHGMFDGIFDAPTPTSAHAGTPASVRTPVVTVAVQA